MSTGARNPVFIRPAIKPRLSSGRPRSTTSAHANLMVLALSGSWRPFFTRCHLETGQQRNARQFLNFDSIFHQGKPHFIESILTGYGITPSAIWCAIRPHCEAAFRLATVVVDDVSRSLGLRFDLAEPSLGSEDASVVAWLYARPGVIKPTRLMRKKLD